jgi:hypothetical protein
VLAVVLAKIEVAIERKNERWRARSARIVSRRRNMACSLLVLVMYCLERKRGCSKGFHEILSMMCMRLHYFSSKHKGQQGEVVL